MTVVLPTRRRLALLGRFAALAFPLAWLAFISLPYLAAALTLTHEDYLGARQAVSTLTFTAILAGLGLFIGAVRSPLISKLYASGLAACAGLVIGLVLSTGRPAAALVAVLWLVFLAWVLGERILGLLFSTSMPPSGPCRAAFSVALAFGLYSHLTLGLALLGLLYRWLFVALLLLLTIIFRHDLLHRLRTSARFLTRAPQLLDDTAEHWFALPWLALLTSWILLVFIQAVAPEINYDSLNYHLALPALYLEQHHFVFTPYNPYSYAALGTEMNYLLAMLLAGQVAAKLTNLAFGCLTAVALFGFGQQFFSRRTAILAASLFATTPLIAWLASTTYIDLALSCYCLLAVMAVYQWLIDRRFAWLALAGIMAGFTLSSKIRAVSVVMPLAVLVMAVSFRSARHSWAHRIAFVLCFWLVTLGTASPWPLLRYVETGNPVYPLLGSASESPATSTVKGIAESRRSPVFRGLERLARLPSEVQAMFRPFGTGMRIENLLRLP